LIGEAIDAGIDARSDGVGPRQCNGGRLAARRAPRCNRFSEIDRTPSPQVVTIGALR